jgi:hypothetical protein
MNYIMCLKKGGRDVAWKDIKEINNIGMERY